MPVPYLGPGGSLDGRSQLTKSGRSILDRLWLRDKSDTGDGSQGTDKYIELGDLVAPFSNFSTSAQGAGFATDTYLAGSGIVLPAVPIVGSLYRAWFDVTKTAAGTATPIINIRLGSAGSTADTSRGLFTFGAGTAAADVALIEIMAWFRTVGSSTSAVLTAWARATTNLTTTGWSNAVKVRSSQSSGFDSTGASGHTIGLSYNGGTSASHTVQQVRAEYLHAA